MESHINTRLLRPQGQLRCQVKCHSGFALIATISVMVLLVMVALAMLSLATIETRSSGHNDAMNTARANARMALMLAIGELQKSAGPDQRVTALASVDTANTSQPHLLGVWKSFTQSNTTTDAINYSSQKDGDFVQWLSSSTTANKISPTYPTQSPDNPVKLIGTGTVSDPSDPSAPTNYISASAIDVTSSTSKTGRYAWHVFDESQKANLTLNSDTPTTDAERIASLGTGGKPGFQINAVYENLENLSDANREKLISLDSSELVSFDSVTNSTFHYLTTGSKSLLVDVANGGYQKDLSLLFENATLPADYADRHIYSESDTPVAPKPDRFGGGGGSVFAEPIPSPDPKWSLLHSHYKLYRSVSTSGSKYSVNASENARFLKGSGYDTVDNPVKDPNPDFFEQQQLLPVISNAQFIFSITPQNHVRNGRSTIYVQFVIDTVITLWNPYDVNLEFSDMEIEFYRFPLQVDFFRNGTLMTREPAHIANMFNAGNLGTGEVWGAQNTIPYRARIQGASQGSTITLKPGEYKVFSPVNATHHHQNWHYLKGMTLREGWDPYAGGVLARLILKDDNNGNIGIPRSGSGTTAYIKAVPGDVYSVEVSAAKVNSSVNSSSFLETNDQEIAAYLKVFQGDGGNLSNTTGLGDVKRLLDQRRTQIGAIEMDLSDAAMASLLPTYGPDEMSKLTIPALADINGNILQGKVPLLIASLRLKTEQDSDAIDGQPNASLWLHNGIANPYFTAGITGDQSEHEKTHQYELTWEPMTSWTNIPTVEIDGQNRGYGGSGVTSGSGVNSAPFLQVPLAPASSLAQFSHAPLNSGGQAPLTTQIVGNSFASPSVPLDLTSTPGSLGTHLDHSYMANASLFDSYFLSTATGQTQAIYGTSTRPLDTVIDEFFDLTQALPNRNFEPVTNTSPVVIASDYDTFAQYLYNKGAFNVNSTSEEAWALFLASGGNDALPILDMLTASSSLTTAASSDDSPYSRFAPMIGDEVDASIDDQNRWKGHRRLTGDQIRTLARNVVAEVKARGPFQSVAEFVNRRLDSDPATANSGTLQTAIENSNINTDFGLATPKNHNELTSSNLTGNSSDGAATQITQADLLNRLASSITVRGDTFLIRTYGEATVGSHTSRVWCEALVQRSHDFVDSTQASTTDSAALNATNQTYGRRFKIVSFRWLSDLEI